MHKLFGDLNLSLKLQICFNMEILIKPLVGKLMLVMINLKLLKLTLICSRLQM